MKLLGKTLSIVAALLVFRAWRDLERDLRHIYSIYRATLKFRIPPLLITTLIAAEDRRFNLHGGVDPIAIVRAAWAFIFHSRLSGGSTLEQQLVRTVTGHYERRLGRKVREIMLACLVHKIIPKRDIPGVYLSIAYFGWRMNGIRQACRKLGTDLTSMSSYQAASIVARLKYPESRRDSEQRIRQIAVRAAYIHGLAVKLRAAERCVVTEGAVNEAILNF